jgi:hypothetical protein
MTTTAAERFHFADFTLDNYRRLLRLARQNYTFRGFTDFRKDERFVLWRHDADLSMHAARNLARLEAEEGVTATYFLQLHSDFYNLLEYEVTECVREIVARGHHLGLHFDSHYYGITSEGQLQEHLLREKDVLEAFFAQGVRVFSFHKPTPLTMNCKAGEYAGLINTYAEYFQTHVGYCSDSNGYWRHRRLEDVLHEARDPRLQVLTHGGCWTRRVTSPRERVMRCIGGRAAKVLAQYEATVREFGREIPDWP